MYTLQAIDLAKSMYSRHYVAFLVIPILTTSLSLHIAFQKAENLLLLLQLLYLSLITFFQTSVTGWMSHQRDHFEKVHSSH